MQVVFILVIKSYDEFKNKFIEKFNVKLYDYAHYLNDYSEGHIMYVDINSNNKNKINKSEIGCKLVKQIESVKKFKNLKFVFRVYCKCKSLNSVTNERAKKINGNDNC